ncbi:PREDICTED: uncharacterized protein LOC107083257 isoform X1 [Cyprinodon variegatus]|uniref:Uncharacterized LOC107083257 n=2 Tax=Cyprinodon variegatus TaxID=28743 RepID=A0A3Q2DVS2_CYPVA|nr:PREDICTED: uncharacterized protein LOC107083257 isoform X1 [Cyprinodon variegatus]
MMDHLETPYEEDDGFIECTVCEKSLKGNSLYKIHLTSPGHLKKEDALVAEGKAVREHIVPKFRDILHYLEYLNLDEPIIGLNFLEEVVNHDPQFGARYVCKLCSQTTNLAEMVCHVIGRKHRQKYVELKRPDLVTWDGNTINTQGGKIMRAKAEIIERQNGRGMPELLLRKGVEGRLNISRVQPRQRPDRLQTGPQRSFPDVPPLLPELKDFRRKREDYDLRNTTPCSLDYPPEASSLKRPYPERDPLEQFYSDEVRRGQVRSQEYQPSPQMSHTEEGNRRWSLERESGGYDRMRRLGSSEPEAKMRNLSATFEGDLSREPLFDIFKDYHHERKDPYLKDAFDRGRAAPAQTLGEVPSTISNIPEPFRRFLKGSAGDEEGQRRRKSRFSDATPEEVNMAKDMYRDDYGRSYTQTGVDLRPVDAQGRPDIPYGESQPPHVREGYSRGGSEKTSIFEILEKFEIENAEEAEFLKSKLSSLLEEFKARKMEKAALPQPYQYDRPQREEPDRRRSEELGFNNGHRLGWNQREQLPEQRFHEYNHGEPRHSSTGRFKDDQPDYLEPMRPHDYKPPPENYFDSHSSVPPLHMEQDSRMQRDPRYSSNMDKITCALMDLVARK